MRNDVLEKKSAVLARINALPEVIKKMEGDEWEEYNNSLVEAGESGKQTIRDYFNYTMDNKLYPEAENIDLLEDDEEIDYLFEQSLSLEEDRIDKKPDILSTAITSEKLSDFKEINLSIFPVSSQKLPFGKWKQFQTEIAPTNVWYEHFKNGGYVGIITGKVSGNLEVIDVDVKNDPSRTIFTELKSKIPEDLYSKLLVQTTVNAGFHLIYRCPDATIEGNQKLALSEANEVIIETRGEGGYICHHLRDYKVIQGNFNLISGEADIPVITPKEREMLLTLARSLTRKTIEKNSKSTFTYKDQAIIDFNDKYGFAG